ncbi:hypothetical protein BHE74_00011156 [Ensete ventricosum]|nr:hypothetical protein BHE74_00011156 [Ensete ventricosum]
MGHEGEDMMHVVGIPVEDSRKEDKDKGQEGIHMVADIHRGLQVDIQQVHALCLKEVLYEEEEEEEEGRRGEEMRAKAAAAGSNISPEGAHEARKQYAQRTGCDACHRSLHDEVTKAANGARKPLQGRKSKGVKDEVSRGLSREAVGVHCVGETKETPRAA